MEKIMKKQRQTRKKNISTKLLAKRALKNKPTWKPAKWYKYLKDLKLGSVFVTESGTRGVLIGCDVNAKVIITEWNARNFDKNYKVKDYLVNTGEYEVCHITTADIILKHKSIKYKWN